MNFCNPTFADCQLKINIAFPIMINIDSTLYPEMRLVRINFEDRFTMYSTLVVVVYYRFDITLSAPFSAVIIFIKRKTPGMPRAHIYTCHQ